MFLHLWTARRNKNHITHFRDKTAKENFHSHHQMNLTLWCYIWRTIANYCRDPTFLHSTVKGRRWTTAPTAHRQWNTSSPCLPQWPPAGGSSAGGNTQPGCSLSVTRCSCPPPLECQTRDGLAEEHPDGKRKKMVTDSINTCIHVHSNGLRTEP